MPFNFLQKGVLGKRTLSEILKEAQTIYESRPLAASYTSSEQTITAAGSLTLAHSLNASPDLIQARLVCKTAELGYSIGDEVILDPGESLSLVPDSANINVRYSSAASVFTIIRKDTGAAAAITIANWRLIIKAWA